MSFTLDSQMSPIAKSEPVCPLWKKGIFSDEDKNKVYFVYVRKHLTQLELGIKQAQIAGQLQIKNFLKDHLIQSLFSEGITHKQIEDEIFSQLSAKDMTKLLNATLPEKVYWEQQLVAPNKSKSEYTVWVLLSFPRQEVESVKAAALKELNKSYP